MGASGLMASASGGGGSRWAGGGIADEDSADDDALSSGVLRVARGEGERVPAWEGAEDLNLGTVVDEPLGHLVRTRPWRVVTVM